MSVDGPSGLSRMLRRMRAAIVCCAAVVCACERDAARVPTWHRDVQPIVARSCTGCHAAGGIAPFALTSYGDAFARRELVRVQVASRLMPPWPPGPGCAEYAGDRSLPENERATLLAWLDNGAAQGDPADARPTSPLPPGGLSRVDRELQLAAAYAPTEGPDEYRCFVLGWPEPERRYVTGFAARPGNAAIVHHVLAFLATPDRVGEFQALDDADAAPGYKCFGGPGGIAQGFGGWVPGSHGGDFPTGTGLPVDPGSKIILQIHYNVRAGPGPSDRTAIQLKLDATIDREAFFLPWADPAWVNARTMRIAAGEADVRHAFAFAPGAFLGLITGNRIPAGRFTIHSAGLHQHLRGTRSRLEIQRAGGARECILDIPRWDFHWQGTYMLQNAKIVQTGDSLSIECHWDNSATNQPDGLPPRDLNWGERTDDEMCLGFLYITQ
jgi:copper type II ascorbate-dependent monooxygenase-like protein